MLKEVNLIHPHHLVGEAVLIHLVQVVEARAVVVVVAVVIELKPHDSIPLSHRFSSCLKSNQHSN